jgi:hypothetical protein
MLVEDEGDVVLLFKMILESDVGLKVDSFTSTEFCNCTGLCRIPMG